LKTPWFPLVYGGQELPGGGYTEVAVITISQSTYRILVGAALTTMLSIGLAGCQQEIISHNPESRAAGVKDYSEGNYADAAGSFRNAVRADPRDYKSQFYLAQCYEKMNQYQQAIQAYKASLGAQPLTLAGQEDKAQKLTTIDALAACIAKRDTNDSELNVIDKQAKASNQPWDYLLLAKIYQDRGDADSALDAYNRAALTDPKDFTIIKEYGLYCEQAGQTQRATQQLRKAYALNPNDEQVNAALYRLHIVPGPGLKDESALVKPAIPVGPLPEVDLSKFKVGGNSDSQEQSAAQPAAQRTQSTQTGQQAAPLPTAQPHD
jgi:tetratricopeptide (TPR) repeat protein